MHTSSSFTAYMMLVTLISPQTYGFIEIRRELDSIKSCRCHNQFQIGSLLHGLFHQAKEYVSVDGPLVSLVQHDNRVLFEIWVNQTLSQEHTVRHVLA